VTAAIVITGAPGSGKSSVAQAFTTLLDNAGIAHGAIESEQLAWGTPWLEETAVHEQLATVLRLQRGYGRRLFVVVATTETQEDLDDLLAAIGAERAVVACLRAPGDVCAARVLAREPERWAGREALAAHARGLADAIPVLPGVDLVLDTDGRDAEAVAAELLADVNGSWVGSVVAFGRRSRKAWKRSTPP
jgi:chloramphenicol 3-O-phosphotransferase